MKLQIFVSYCHDDIRPDDSRLRVFIRSLQKAGGDAYDVVVDYLHKEASIGANLDEFMKKIDAADAAIILLTRGYKERVARKGATGVYSEFRRIHDRILKSEETKTYGRAFLALPLVFTDTFDESCPPEIRHLICGNLTWLYVAPGSELGMRRDIENQLTRFVSELSSRIAAITTTRSAGYRRRQEKLFQSFLFSDTKSRWDDPSNHPYLESAFVKTASFLKAMNREVSFIVGRKGAGKSTITHVLPLLSKPKPELVLRLDFDHLPFQMCYNVLREHPAEASDLRKAYSPIFSYQFLWDVFLHMCWCWELRELLPQSSNISSFLRQVLGDEIVKIATAAERDLIATRVFFVYAFEQLVNFIRANVKASASETSLARSIGAFSPSGFRDYLFGSDVWSEIVDTLNAYENGGKSLLVTADGFDVMIGYFTTAGADAEGAAEFERELLLALFQIVLNKGPARSGVGTLYKMANFCVAIPHDRFLHVKRFDRDKYQYRQRFSRIAWTGIELSALVRKRLALLRGVEDAPGAALEERLASVMKKEYSELPDEVGFQFGAATYRLPLFIYVLRHSLWRPRDILFYYAALLAAADHFRKKREVMPVGFVRQVIAGCTRHIVSDEFLDEFGTSIKNLRHIVQAFRQGPQVLDWSSLRDRIEPMRFETNLPEGESANLEWKVELLYDIGFLGIILDRRSSEQLMSFRHAFCFNEPDLLGERLGRDMYPSFHYAVHPLFVEYLHLDTGANPELILPLDWEYLHHNELLRGIAAA